MAYESPKSYSVPQGKPLDRMTDFLGMTSVFEPVRVPLLGLIMCLPNLVVPHVEDSCTKLGNDVCNNFKCHRTICMVGMEQNMKP